MIDRSKRVALLGICTTLALVLAYVEILLGPLFPSLPGIKMGLPNVVIIFLLYRRSAASALTVSILRVIWVGILFGNAMAFIYSVAGAILSFSVMVLLKKTKLLSPVGVSVAGGVTHNAGQILTAMVLLDTAELGYYLAVLTVTGTVAGVLVGLCGSVLINKIPKNLIN